MRNDKLKASIRRWRGGLWGVAALMIGVAGWQQWHAPPAADLFAAAEAARHRGALKEALIQYKRLLQATPNDLSARWHLGQTYLDLQQPAAALSEFTRAAALGAPPAEIELDLVRAHLELREYDKARALLDAYAGPRSAALDALKIKATLGRGETDAARHLLGAARERTPQDASLDVATARLALAEHDFAGADAALGAALAAAPDNLEALILKARVALTTGNTSAAASGFQRALTLAPENLEALAGLAKAQIALRQLTEAASTVARLKRQAPKIDEGLLLTGMLAYAQEDWAHATSALAEFVHQQPTQAQALLMLAASCFHQGNFQQAEAQLNALHKLVPDYAPARKLMAVVLLKQHRGPEAVASLSPLLDDARQPADAGALVLLSQAYAASGDQAKAGEILARAETAASSASVAAQTQLALAQWSAGNAQAGLATLNRLADRAPADREVRQTLTAGQLNQGEVSAALDSARLLLEMAPEAALSHYLAGVAWLRAGDLKQAAAAFEAALGRDAAFAPALVNQALLALHDRDPARAQRKLEAALKADDTNVPATRLLATLKERAGDTAGALSVLTRTLERRPDEPELRWQLAEHQLRTGNRENALANAAQAFNAAPGAPAYRLRWGAFQLRAESPDAAFKTLIALHTEFPQQLEATALLADAERLTKRFAAAREHYDLVLKAQPDLLPVWWSRFATELGDRQFAAAKQVLAAMRERFPEGVDADNAAGELATAQGEFAAASKAFRAVLDKAPTPRALERLVAAQRLQQDLAGARATLRQWLQSHPEDGGARLLLGLTEMDDRQWPAARRQLEQVLAAAPAEPVALVALAKVYDRLDDPRALALAERLSQALPGDPVAADTLGWMLIRKRRVQQGLALLEGAHRARPDDPDIAYHYAAALAEAGLREKALEAAEALLRQDRPFAARADVETLRLTLRGEAPAATTLN